MLPDVWRLDQEMCACRFQFVRFTEMAETGRILSSGNLTTRWTVRCQHRLSPRGVTLSPRIPELPQFLVLLDAVGCGSTMYSTVIRQRVFIIRTKRAICRDNTVSTSRPCFVRMIRACLRKVSDSWQRPLMSGCLCHDCSPTKMQTNKNLEVSRQVLE